MQRKENKKIRNASSCIDGSIAFKSQLEKTIYNTLKQLNIDVKYEPVTYELYPGFMPLTPFYDKESDTQQKKRIKEGDKNKSKQLVLKNSKIIGIRYTPDFYFKYKNIDVYIEAKGIENDVYYIKKKLFRKYLDDRLIQHKQKSIFFEVYTKTQLLQVLNILKEYA